METTNLSSDTLDSVLSLSELAAGLGVSVQTIYDLRSQGRGPRGFRVGRHLKFRASEIYAWLSRMEEADAERHPAPDGMPYNSTTSWRTRPNMLVSAVWTHGQALQ